MGQPSRGGAKPSPAPDGTTGHDRPPARVESGTDQTAGDRITLSVVVASKAGSPFLERCLAGLVHQTPAEDTEVIVATTAPSGLGAWETGAPRRRVLRRCVPTSIPELRRLGLEAADGDLVAFVEERCVPAPGWIERLRAAQADAAWDVVGGPVAPPDSTRSLDWAVYFCEYSEYLPRPARRPSSRPVTTANAAYRRSLLLSWLPLLDRGYWEAVLHPALRDHGARVCFMDELMVRKQGDFRLWPYLAQRYRFSRAYAGERGLRDPVWRWRHLLAVPVLPLVLLGRVFARGWGVPGGRVRLLQASPIMMPIVVVWALGEGVGCLAGAGDALSRVE